MTPWVSDIRIFVFPMGLISGYPESRISGKPDVRKPQPRRPNRQPASRMFDWTRDGMCPITHQGRDGTISKSSHHGFNYCRTWMSGYPDIKPIGKPKIRICGYPGGHRKGCTSLHSKPAIRLGVLGHGAKAEGIPDNPSPSPSLVPDRCRDPSCEEPAAVSPPVAF